MFRDRRQAGALLGEALARYAGRSDVIVLGLPRGGVPVAYEVAMRLGAPLDVLVVRKLGVPGQEELAMGAIATGGVQVLDERVLARARVSAADFARVVHRETIELGRRERVFRGARPPADVRDRTVIVVDDGLATGATMRAAIAVLRERAPARIVSAVPVGAPDSCAEIGDVADESVCLAQPEELGAVGLWYDDFSPTADAEVHALLAMEPAREQRP